MILQFTFNGNKLTAEEANSILSATDSSNEIKVEIQSLIKKKINHQKIFDLAVEQKNPALAALAAKIAITTEAPQERKVIELYRDDKNLLDRDQIRGLARQYKQRPSYKTVGVATLLMMATDEPRTIRSVCCEMVRTFFNDSSFPVDSSVFRGYEFSPEGEAFPNVSNEKYHRNEQYYTSPSYLSTCEGFRELKAKNLISVRTKWSHMADKTRSGVSSRKYYEYELTRTGQMLLEAWPGIEMFVRDYWAQRSSSVYEN